MVSGLAIATALAIAAVTSPGCTSTRGLANRSYDELPSGACAVLAEVRARRGKESELRAATLPLVDAVRSEPGNLLYFLHEDRENPGHFVFYEIFATPADFEAHNATPHVLAWFARLPELADGGVKVTRMAIVGN